MELFTYGTLLFADVLTVLLGRVPDRTPATAAGWRVAALPGRSYPGLVRDEAGTATGLVLGGLTGPERDLLHAYEGAEYRLATITLTSGASCATYVWQAAAGPGEWSRHRFAADHLAGFVEHCLTWRAGYRPC